VYESKGNIKWIGETQSFPSGFTKREFVITTEHDKYPQDLKFEVVKDKCGMLDEYHVGTPVTVSFDIRGNEYNGKYFVNLSCWKLQAEGSGGAAKREVKSSGTRPQNAEPSAADLRNESDFDEDDVPF
jgi:hypothetical protein